MQFFSSLLASFSFFVSGLFGGSSNIQVPEAPLPKRVHQQVVVNTVLPEMLATTTVSTSSAAHSLVYLNKKYNFSLEFPKSWEGYTVDESKPNFISFGLKDQKMIFGISVFSKKDWQALVDENEKTDAPIPTMFLESNKSDKYVFAYVKSQDSTDTTYPFRKDIDVIASTFLLHVDKKDLFSSPFGDRISQTLLVNGDPIATINKDFAEGEDSVSIIYTTNDKSKVYFALYRETEGQECVSLEYLDTIKSKYVNTSLDYCPGYEDSPILESSKKEVLPLVVQYGKFDLKKVYALNLETEKEIIVYSNTNKRESLTAECADGMYDFVYTSDIASLGNKRLKIGVYKEEGQATERCSKQRKYTKIRDDIIDLNKIE